MHLYLLGTGSPTPLPQRQGAAVLLSHGDEHLLFDAGRGVTTQLVRCGVSPHAVSAVFLTHHHYDHIGNLGDLMLTAWHGGSVSLPILRPPGTDAIVAALLDHVYHRDIMVSQVLAQAMREVLCDIHTVVAVTSMMPGESVQQSSWRVTAGAVEHGHALGLTYEQWPCLGYRVEAYGKCVVISGDTVDCAGVRALAHNADVLVQCCHLAESAITTPADRLLADTVIAASGQVGKIAAAANVRALVLTHFGMMTPEMLATIVTDVRRDYRGPLYIGEDLMYIAV